MKNLILIALVLLGTRPVFADEIGDLKKMVAILTAERDSLRADLKLHKTTVSSRLQILDETLAKSLETGRMLKAENEILRGKLLQCVNVTTQCVQLKSALDQCNSGLLSCQQELLRCNMVR